MKGKIFTILVSVCVTILAYNILPALADEFCSTYAPAECYRESYTCDAEYGQLDCRENYKCGLNCAPSASSCASFGSCYPNDYVCEQEHGKLDCSGAYKCGTHCSPPTPPGGGSDGQLFSNPSKIDTIEELLEAIINFVYAMSFPIVTGIVLYAAFVMMTSAGKPEKFQQGINIIIYAAIGFIVVLLSKGVVFIIRSIFEA